MNLGIISDLHVDLNKQPQDLPVQEALLEVVKERELTHLIVAGDISNDSHLSLSVLHELRERSGIPVLFVPGNHDYWSKENGITDTWEIYKAYQSFPGCLSEQPYILNDEWVVIGNTGWYDYTLGEPTYGSADFEKMKFADRTWQDSIYVHWGRSNSDMHRYFYEAMERELAEHQGKQIILVTHMLGHPFFKVPMPHPRWEYFNAFLGSAEYADLYVKYNVHYAVMGHVHYRKKHVHQNTEMVCACLGYRQEWTQEVALDEIRSCLQVISL
ncbi:MULTISPECIES: metallophosphoesterase [Paenibacillus]|jgi:putative phosphoesterase|uniref:Calcineurin-like phosphoesterase domain-containing protein n=1 Tax=Paenibacillus glucanolyticus TaxID=59843 RepID=A0A163MC53_9BACL|nr:MULTISPECIES: metallophosphoesterase [Paenibacillus]ETT40317.1 hypothetical protein C169_08388 [Paenibacillus sp. FSL R5-808]KZS48923.1 hypothetical protein AWU65_24805 [Paenibacillus glucanolyticus]MCA4750938.1 metallophosphoesterase family protein [Mycolicibacterium fortuitum]OMF73320.1 hypothetical protein BK142_19095 [Paenibacillus glucanolyticus]